MMPPFVVENCLFTRKDTFVKGRGVEHYQKCGCWVWGEITEMTEGWILFGCVGNVGGVALSRDGKNGGEEGREGGKKGGEGEGHQVGFRGEVILLGLLEWELGALCRMSD